MENFPNLMREGAIQMQEAQGPDQEEPKEAHCKINYAPIIIKMAKSQHTERILKAAREKQEVTYKEVLISLAGDFSAETSQVRTKWQEILQVMKSKGLQPRLLYQARLSIKREDEIRSFSDKRRLKE